MNFLKINLIALALIAAGISIAPAEARDHGWNGQNGYNNGQSAGWFGGQNNGGRDRDGDHGWGGRGRDHDGDRGQCSNSQAYGNLGYNGNNVGIYPNNYSNAYTNAYPYNGGGIANAFGNVLTGNNAKILNQEAQIQSLLSAGNLNPVQASSLQNKLAQLQLKASNNGSVYGSVYGNVYPNGYNNGFVNNLRNRLGI